MDPSASSSFDGAVVLGSPCQKSLTRSRCSVSVTSSLLVLLPEERKPALALNRLRLRCCRRHLLVGVEIRVQIEAAIC